MVKVNISVIYSFFTVFLPTQIPFTLKSESIFNIMKRIMLNIIANNAEKNMYYNYSFTLFCESNSQLTLLHIPALARIVIHSLIM